MSRALLFLLCSFLPLACFAQQAASNSQNTQAPVFHAESRLVVLDVLATDDHGKAVRDLTRDDFAVLEDGHAQQISQFEPHVAADEKRATENSGEYRNVPAVVPNAVNIVLLDMLNTPTHDQADARRHLLDFLRHMPKGRQVALYTLDTRLHLIQNFTGDSDTLLAAVEKALMKPSVLDSEADRAADGELVRLVASNAPAQVAQRIQDFLRNNETAKNDQRVGLTLQSLEQIAHSVAGVPGRKNLIWLSSGFPLHLEGTDESDRQRVSTTERLYHDAVEHTAAVLADSQVAVYPVDAQGIAVAGVDVEVSGRGMFDTERSGTYGDVLSQQATQFSAVHETMDALARDTGGHAFYNGNDLKTAITQSMDMGSSYYTLAYSPSNNDWNGKLRKIEVKMPHRKGLKLVYRRSYFAVPKKSLTDEELKHQLVSSLDPEIAASTMLTLRVKLAVDEKNANSVTLDYMIDRRELQFEGPDPQHRVALVDLVMKGWKASGAENGAYGQSLKVPVSSGASSDTITFRQRVDLRPGTVRIRIGVLDRTSGRIGTLDIPLPGSVAATSQGSK